MYFQLPDVAATSSSQNIQFTIPAFTDCLLNPQINLWVRAKLVDNDGQPFKTGVKIAPMANVSILRIFTHFSFCIQCGKMWKSLPMIL